MKFPSSQKIQLVNLLTTLIKSSSDELLRSMFNTEGSGKLCELIFYRAQYDEWGGKKASLICLCEMVCNELLLPVINRIISPSAVAHICWNSLLLPDMEIQTNIVCTIYLLCQVMP